MYSFWHLNPNKLSPPHSLLNLVGGIVKKKKKKSRDFSTSRYKNLLREEADFFLICTRNSRLTSPRGSNLPWVHTKKSALHHPEPQPAGGPWLSSRKNLLRLLQIIKEIVLHNSLIPADNSSFQRREEVETMWDPSRPMARAVKAVPLLPGS